jgi:hypothetical protein
MLAAQGVAENRVARVFAPMTGLRTENKFAIL